MVLGFIQDREHPIGQKRYFHGFFGAALSGSRPHRPPPHHFPVISLPTFSSHTSTPSSPPRSAAWPPPNSVYNSPSPFPFHAARSHRSSRTYTTPAGPGKDNTPYHNAPPHSGTSS